MLMQVLVGLITLAIVWALLPVIRLVVDGSHYVWWLVFMAGLFAAGRFMSSDWEKEQDDRDIASWLHKWRCRFSRIWPVSGEILPPDKSRKISPPHRDRRFPDSS